MEYKIVFIIYLLFLSYFNSFCMDIDVQKASYYRVHPLDNAWKLCIYDPDGNEIRSEKLNELVINPFGFFDCSPKPRPIKAVISPHLTLGRSLGFFDKHNNLIGEWRKYDGGENLRNISQEEQQQFTDMDISCLQSVENRGGSTPAPKPKVIHYNKNKS